ncbi:hypothetical protein D3C80_1432140 [compost metagenome]
MEPNRNRLFVTSHLTAYTNRNTRLFGSLDGLTDHAQDCRMIRMIHMRYFFIHPVYGQHILNQIISSYAKEIDLLSEQVRDCGGRWNLNHNPNLYVMTVADSTFIQIIFGLFK